MKDLNEQLKDQEIEAGVQPPIMDSDKQEAQVVKQAIKDDQALAPVAKDIQVTVKDGDITLDGKVATEQQMNLATNTAKAIAVDEEVKNHLEVTHKKTNINGVLLTALVLFVISFVQTTPSHASGYLVVGDRGHHGRYTQVVVGSDTYYYNEGVYYTGSPDHYVVVNAPVGAIIYNVPSGYEEVEIDGSPYYRYHDTYYRHGGRGYEVVNVDRSRVQKRGYARAHQQDHGNDDRHDNR